MKKNIVLILTALCFIQAARAQPYGDEWIDYDKVYFKVGLARDGIYRISYSDLADAGFPVNTVDPRRIQLFYKGAEQSVFVAGQGDAVFNTDDYIEFYGLKNDGRTDTRLYRPEAAQPHPFHNIYSDSSYYFLTYHLLPDNGKRMASFSENNTLGIPAVSSHSEDLLQLDVAVYAPGVGYSIDNHARYSYFDQGEGWSGRALQEGQFNDYVMEGLVNGLPSAGTPRLEVLLTGRDDLPHVAEVQAGSSSLRSLGTITFDNFETATFTADLAWDDISASGNLTVRVKALGRDGGNDLLSASYVRVIFPQRVDMMSAASKKFFIPDQNTGKSYLEIANTLSQTRLYDITDPNNVVRIGSTPVASGIGAMISGTTVDRTILANASTFITPNISKAGFRKIDARAYDYIIISHKFLMQSAGGSSNPVESYAAYRASPEGGGFSTLVADMDMLYDQYNYGVKNPLAIHDFMRFLVDNGDPQFLFLIGKGLSPAVNFHRRPEGVIVSVQGGVRYEIRDLVPSAGTPGSDILFTAGLGGTTYEPAVPVGRLPARDGNNVMTYLEKIKTMEMAPFDNLWRKRVLHLSGGISSSELVRFRRYMDGFKAIAEDDFFGGEVKTIAKTSGSTVQLINVSDEVNTGLNLITFYGHSAPSITDIDIGFATDPLLGYNNQDRYPVFLINGCNAGEFFRGNIIFGEDWVLAKDRGALGFIAHSSVGFSNSLRRYTTIFYEVAYGDSLFINRSISEVQKEVAVRYAETGRTSPTDIAQMQQMVLLGDPALKLFGAQYPDYAVTDDGLLVESLDTDPVTALSDSFAIRAIVRNYGRTQQDSITVRVDRSLADNSVITYNTVLPPVDYIDTLTVIIRKDTENGFGNNSFTLTLDAESLIEEADETNNTASTDFFIPLFGTRNLFPANYAIVSTQSVKLIAQSTDVLEGNRTFLLELDTVKSFDSPYLKTNRINSTLLAQWEVELLPDVAPDDSVVYYWRSRYATPKPGESADWVSGSFTYIEGSPDGWAQVEFDQLIENTLTGLSVNTSGGAFDYLKVDRQLDITTYGDDYGATPADISVQIDGTEYIINNDKRCRSNTLNLIAFDKGTAVPYAAVPLIFQDARTCGRQPQVINSFRLAELESGENDLMTYFDNVAEGDSIAVFTIGDPQPADWSPAVLSKLESMGISSASLAALEEGEAFIAFGRQGAAPGAAQVVTTDFSPKAAQQLQGSLFFTGVASEGTIRSPAIGPAAAWGTLSLQTDATLSDDTELSVFGIEPDGSETLLIKGVNSFPADLSAIVNSAIRIVFHTRDTENLFPPQLQKWLVTYEPVAEGVILAGEDVAAVAEVQEGEPVSRSFAFANISDRPFADSLVVRQEVFNTTTRSRVREDIKIEAPAPGDTTDFKVTIDTRGKVGNNNLIVNINPRLLPEVYYENNLIRLTDYITVEKDDTHPVLEVLFDGRRIINGDIVSPSPLIAVRLKDENPIIKTTDTTHVNLFIKQECEGCVFRRVSYSGSEVNWFPADESKDFTVEYKPQGLTDGIYTLRIEASDQSGNSSGDEPYSVSFEVINASTITNFFPYPNPFSTSTRFIFTLTGSDIPDEMIIQILTISGKVVREITQDELGLVHIGHNMSDYAWDGRDEFGDQLANGVYLYKVLVKRNGMPVDARSTSADKAFKKGFGKLYLLK